jgi:hypothetical protein
MFSFQNMGWFIAVPDAHMYSELWRLSFRRLSRPWNASIGWGEPFPERTLRYRGSTKFVEPRWDFNAASADQGAAEDVLLII